MLTFLILASHIWQCRLKNSLSFSLNRFVFFVYLFLKCWIVTNSVLCMFAGSRSFDRFDQQPAIPSTVTNWNIIVTILEQERERKRERESAEDLTQIVCITTSTADACIACQCVCHAKRRRKMCVFVEWAAWLSKIPADREMRITATISHVRIGGVMHPVPVWTTIVSHSDQYVVIIIIIIILIDANSKSLVHCSTL